MTKGNKNTGFCPRGRKGESRSDQTHYTRQIAVGLSHERTPPTTFSLRLELKHKQQQQKISLVKVEVLAASINKAKLTYSRQQNYSST